MMDDIVFIGDWVKDRVLGSGSFGTVILWKHKNTDEKLAIKTCKWGDELTAKHKERWTTEVEMLRSCRNPNIVGTKELPVEFVKGLERANPSKLPVLCMEYCSGGDLRQLLNKPDSCAGLKEPQVRAILNDIRCAMQFLHENKITHRDLKPENIVMYIDDTLTNVHNQAQRKITYKLIDLGYAKEIDSKSVCASFVGTLQYLAPEILYSKTYSNSVDYWSFGLLAFEIICGVRPFLPFMAPVQWMPHVKTKKPDHICVYETFHGDIEYSSEVYPENHISKPLKVMLEKWLRVALQWDPKLRGRDSLSKVTFNIPSETKGSSSNAIIFSMLENILSKRIIKIFSAPMLAQLAYEFENTCTISKLKEMIQEGTKIPVKEQILISPTNYIDLADDEEVLKYWNENNNITLFLYRKNCIIRENVESIVPKPVQRCLEQPKALYNYKNSQNLYRASLYFVINQMETYDLLINSLVVKSEALKCESKQLLLKHNSVDKVLGKLIVQQETLTNMVKIGNKHIEGIKQNGKTHFMGGFDKIFKDANDLAEKSNKLQSAWEKLSVRLQSAARRSNELTTDLSQFVSKYNFNTIYSNAMHTYIAYKKVEYSSEFRSKERQCHDIIKVCYDCLKLKSKILHDLHNLPFMLKLLDLSTEFSIMSGVISGVAENVNKLTAACASTMNELTTCLWNTISLVVNDAESLSDLPYSVLSFQKNDFKIGGPVSNHNIDNKVEVNEDLKSLIEDSIKIRQNHIKLSEKIISQKQKINSLTIDFSFLEVDK